jgi:cytochrome c peroxidase
LRKPDGEWLQQDDWSAYLSLRDNRNGFTLKGIPEGKYAAVRFLVGVRPAINKADVSKYPPNHPLNPTVNTLWWGWQGGFVFMAIEGSWRRPDGSISGYSFHVANDPNLMTIELPCDLPLTQDALMKVQIDPDAIFKGLSLNDERNSTHSRSDDDLATQLHTNIEHAFAVQTIAASNTATTPAASAAVILPPGETLHPFTFAAHFPQPSLPGDNPLTNEGIALGKALFNDKRLSINGTQSCADCHDVAHAFTDPKQLSIGAEGQTGTRNAMPLFNLAWKQRFFWDGRASSLREQVLQPIQNPIEMHETLPGVEKKLGLTADRIARVLEQYLLTLVSDDAKIDRVMRGQEKFTAQEQRGFELFSTEYDPRRGQFGADCFHCHGGTTFQSMTFANNGLDTKHTDLGLGAITHKPGDEAKFAVPSLRNVSLTAPYMHDGRFATLEAVISHYDHGVQRSATLDPNLAKHPSTGLGLSKEDQAALIAFLGTLTDARFAKP